MWKTLLRGGAAMAAAMAWSALAGTVTGTAAYRERIALPPDAVFEAVLQDVSRAGAPAQVIGRATLDPAGQPPFRFEITYDDQAVLPGHRYAVRATIRHRGRLLFTTDTHVPAFGGGAPLQLRLVAVARRPGHASPHAGVPDSPLRNTYWKLTQLNGAPVTLTERQREPHLIFLATEPRLAGSGGCNRIMGGFEVEGDRLQLENLAGTMMACLDGMEQETQFLQALGRVARFRIAGDRLELIDAGGTVLAQLQAGALR